MMKEKMMFGALLAALVMSGSVSAEEANGKRAHSPDFSQWSQNYKKSGLYNSSQKNPMTDIELLSHLDKEGRVKYRSLSKDDQQQVLAIINQSGSKNYNKVIDDFIARHRESVEKEQVRMLHNGMNRISKNN